jgi:hypothetical protein
MLTLAEVKEILNVGSRRSTRCCRRGSCAVCSSAAAAWRVSQDDLADYLERAYKDRQDRIAAPRARTESTTRRSSLHARGQCSFHGRHRPVAFNGNDHIHIAVSLVREDGTKASTHGDYKRAQKTCRELETKYGLEELSSVHATRGYDPAEKATAVRDEREMHRASLARKVRASASASGSEAEFVRRARDTGLLVRPRYAKDTTDVIVG